jgi:hypothetical protein
MYQAPDFRKYQLNESTVVFMFSAEGENCPIIHDSRSIARSCNVITPIDYESQGTGIGFSKGAEMLKLRDLL